MTRRQPGVPPHGWSSFGSKSLGGGQGSVGTEAVTSIFVGFVVDGSALQHSAVKFNCDISPRNRRNSLLTLEVIFFMSFTHSDSLLKLSARFRMTSA